MHDMTGKLVPSFLKIGDKVVLPEYGGSSIELHDGEYHIYKDSDISGVLEN